jgi:hypothetical protein
LETIATGVNPLTGSKGRFAWIAAFVVKEDERRHSV